MTRTLKFKEPEIAVGDAGNAPFSEVTLVDDSLGSRVRVLFYEDISNLDDGSDQNRRILDRSLELLEAAVRSLKRT